MSRDEKLYWACGRDGDLSTVRQMVAQGADINLPNSDFHNCSPLMYSLMYPGRKTTSIYLLSLRTLHTEYIRVSDNWTALHQACSRGADSETIDMILARVSCQFVNIKCSGSYGPYTVSALSLAVRRNNQAAVTTLSNYPGIDWSTEDLITEAR